MRRKIRKKKPRNTANLIKDISYDLQGNIFSIDTHLGRLSPHHENEEYNKLEKIKETLTQAFNSVMDMSPVPSILLAQKLGVKSDLSEVVFLSDSHVFAVLNRPSHKFVHTLSAKVIRESPTLWEVTDVRLTSLSSSDILDMTMRHLNPREDIDVLRGIHASLGSMKAGDYYAEEFHDYLESMIEDEDDDCFDD